MPILNRPAAPTLRRLRLLVAFLVLTTPLLGCALGAGLAAPESERRPAEVMGWRGAAWLEREDRGREERPEEVIRTMGLSDGDVVADIGCGTGYFSRPMARAVAPRGKVYAVDIQPEMLGFLRKMADREGLSNIEPVLGESDDPGLPDESVDWILLVDAYHELQQPKVMLAKMWEALKPDGKVALLEYRLEGSSAIHIKTEHRMSPRQVMGEWEPAGFRLVEQHEFLPSQHFFVFEKDRDHVFESTDEPAIEIDRTGVQGDARY